MNELVEKVQKQFEELSKSIGRIPSSILVSTNTYNSMICGTKEIVEGLQYNNLYYGMAIRGIEGIKDNCVEVYDQFGKLMETKQFYDFNGTKAEVITTPSGDFKCRKI